MKLDIIMHYDVDTNTGEIKYIGKEELKVDTKKSTTKKSSSKVDENPEPIVKLEPTKLVLTQGAVDLLQVCEDCRVDIKYNKRGKQLMPLIGTDKAFNTKGGNLLTKSNTVRYSGSNNAKLAAYGDTFKLEPSDTTGVYWLIGNAIPEEKEVPEELVNINDELDITNLDDIDESTDLSSLDYSL